MIKNTFQKILLGIKIKVLLIKNITFNFKYKLRLKRIAQENQIKINTLREDYHKTSEVNIYFVVNSMQAWKLVNLYDLIKSSDIFLPAIIVVPSQVDSGKSVCKLYQYFKEKNLNVIKGFNANNEPLNIEAKIGVGIYFFSDPYNNIYPIHFEEIIKKYIACYVPYYFMATNHVGGSTLIPNTYCINDMWRIYMPHDAVKNIFSKNSANKGINSKVVGYPAAERLYSKLENQSGAWKNNDGRLKVIYAPHHSIGWGEKSLATFTLYGEFLKELSIKYASKLSWSFKPHPNLKKRLYKHPDWGEKKTEEYYGFWENQPHTQLDEGEYEELFLTSDAIIHDCSSFIVEYAFTRKPSLYLVNENNLKGLLNEFGEGVMSIYQKARCGEEIEGFINDIINEKVDSSKEKWSYFNDYVDRYYKDKLPSERIIDDIKQSLGVLSE